jgi:thiamine biosynthesis protein ThiS
MRLVVNGQEREAPDGASINWLLEEAKLAPEKVAVEVNRRLRRTERYGESLAEGDVVEIVTFVGGG